MILDTEKLKAEMEKVAGQWDGDESGRAEDKAYMAKDIKHLVYQIETAITQLNNDDF